MKPRLLDLFCGAGGCTKGYQRAGFYVVGVDIKPQPHYCGDDFYQADALEFVAEHGREYDAIHASPPCQAWSVMQYANHMKKDHPKLIAQTRQELQRINRPWIIENVPGAPLINPIVLCGIQFGLRIIRHRLFESNIFILSMPHLTHPEQEKVRGRVPNGYLDSLRYIGFTTGSSMKAFRDALGCEWMTPDEGRQAIPPAYTEFIGKQLMNVLEATHALS